MASSVECGVDSTGVNAAQPFEPAGGPTSPTVPMPMQILAPHVPGMWPTALQALGALLALASAVLVVVHVVCWMWDRITRGASLRGRVVLVTGAASGIGAALASEVCRRHADSVALVDVNKAGLDAIKRELDGLIDDGVLPKTTVIAVVCDVSDHAAVAELPARVDEALARAPGSAGAARHVDVLVNNAGIVHGKALTALTPEEVKRTVGVNLLAHMWMARAFLPAMAAAKRGLIVTVSSVMGLMGSSALTDYCASKFGVLGFHEALTLELWRRGCDGVRTMSVAPYATASGMFDGVFEGPGARNPLRSALFPMLSVDDVARGMCDGIERGARQVVLPLRLTPLPSLVRALLPAALFEAVVAWMGGLRGMDNFRGRRN